MAHDPHHPATGTARALVPGGAPSFPAGAGTVRLDNTEPLDETQADWLATLQGNILRGHGRDLGLHLFIHLPDDRHAAGRLLAALTAKFVTTAKTQFQQVLARRNHDVDGGLFGTLGLTASGYRRLGRPVDAYFPPQAMDDQEPTVNPSLFQRGMRASHTMLGDAPDAVWEFPYGQGEIDGVLILADDDGVPLLEASTLASRMVTDAGGRMIGVERGVVRRNEKDKGAEAIEHFGFVDGRSQPLFLADDFQAKPGKALPPMTQWNPFEPLGRVLIPDPAMAASDPRCHGSFLVFRKLQQNVKKFHAQLADLAATLHLQGTAAQRVDHAGALVVGRFKDGTPITQSAHPGVAPALSNDFTYEDDVRGGRCPLHAHIRKVNPRGHSLRLGETLDVERRHTIVRRSLTYGERAHDETPETLPATGVGVLFMCYQASIERQFAFLQQRWCGTAWFPQAHVGVDALVGQDDPREMPGPGDGHTNESHVHDWPAAYGQDPSIRAPFASCIDTLGGEFFFVPSVPFLQSLAEPT